MSELKPNLILNGFCSKEIEGMLFSPQSNFCFQIAFRPIRNVWEVMKAQTETSGLAHLKSAHQLSAELTKITEIGEQGREKRRPKEETVR